MDGIDFQPDDSGSEEIDFQLIDFQPEMVVQSPSLSTLDAPHIIAKGSSGILGGVPEAVMRNPMSGVTGAAGKAGIGIARFFNRNVPNVAQEPNFFPEANSKDGELAGMVADLAGGLISPIGAGKNLIKGGNFIGKKLFPSSIAKAGDVKTVARLEGVRDAVMGGRANLAKQFGIDLDAITAANPGVGVDSTEALFDLKNAMASSPKLKRLVNSTPLLKNAINNPRIAKSMPLKEHQELINQISSSLPSGLSKKLGLINPEERILLDHVNDIRDSALNSFPDLHMARDEYRQGIEAFKKIRGNIGEKGLENFINNDFKNAEVRNIVQKLLGDNPEAIKLIKKIQGQKRLSDFFGRAGDAIGTASIGAGGYAIAKKLSGG